jgi:hypothetical protein
MQEKKSGLAFDQLWQRFLGLPADAKQILRLKSLVFLPTTRDVFQDCLIRSGLRMQNGRAWSNGTINPLLEDLKARRLLNADLACTPLLLHPVAIDAVASPDGKLMLEAVARAFATPSGASSYRYVSPSFADLGQRLVRLAVYANDEAAFRFQSDLFDQFNTPYRTADYLRVAFQDATVSAHWVTSRHPIIQLALFEAKLDAVLRGDMPGTDLPR